MSDVFDAFESSLSSEQPAAFRMSTMDDPAAEFLAREQAELAKIENNGFALDEQAESAPSTQNTASNDNNADLLNNLSIRAEPAEDTYSAIFKADQLSAEPERMKLWREEQKARLETKDIDEEQKKKEWREAAKKELDDWYKNRQEQLSRTHENNKALEAELVGPRDSTPGQEWDRVAKLCDFNPKANKNLKDVGRMRSILLQLKQQPLVK